MGGMDRGRRRGARAGAVVAWALAALVAGVVAWWGVTLVGGQARRDGADVLSAAQVADALGQARATASPTAGVGPTPTPTPTVTSTPSVSATPAPPAGASDEVARTAVVAGGQVGAACRGGAVVLLFATPDDGWSVDVRSAGPEHVEVKFRRGEQETEVRTECVGGVPTATVETED